MDPENQIVQLCSQGMRAEAAGLEQDALELFLRAWELAGDDYEACVAAHYVARHQPTPQQTLHWNQECLKRADLVADDRVTGFYASLHLNLAKAYADLDQPEQAGEHYVLAAAHIDAVPPGQYADWTRLAIAEGLRSSGAIGPSAVDDLLTDLFASLAERREWRGLGMILPAYLTDLGTAEDRLRLTSALHMVHAARWLLPDEREILREAINVSSTDTALS